MARKTNKQTEEKPNSSSNFKISIKCKNQKQKDFLKILKDKSNEICFGIGSAGSGKSYISLAYALSALSNDNTPFKKIVIVVPTCEAGNMSLGFLKGTLTEKVEPFINADRQTMIKILEHSKNENPKQVINDLFKNECITYEIVNFVRGATYDNSIILINEAENFSKEEMLLLLTRIGENAKIIITGDPVQMDRKDIKRSKQSCGMTYALEKLTDLEEVDHIIFDNEDIVRNPLIQKIIDRWN